MLEENKVNDGQNGVSQNGTDGQGTNEQPTRSEQRQKDLAEKLKEQEGRHALEIEEKDKARIAAETKSKELEFELGLTREAAKYPNASKYKDEIKSYTSKGLSVEEATKLVLVNKNELVTNQDIQRNSAETSSFGGSSATIKISGEQDPAKMQQSERRAALEKLEADGKIGLKGNSIFVE